MDIWLCADWFIWFVVLQVAEAQEELSFLESDPELFLRESLHRVGYSGALGNPLFPTKEALARIDRGAIRSFYFVSFYSILICIQLCLSYWSQCLLFGSSSVQK
jgi:hypothetical protein